MYVISFTRDFWPGENRKMVFAYNTTEAHTHTEALRNRYTYKVCFTWIDPWCCSRFLRKILRPYCTFWTLKKLLDLYRVLQLVQWRSKCLWFPVILPFGWLSIEKWFREYGNKTSSESSHNFICPVLSVCLCVGRWVLKWPPECLWYDFLKDTKSKRQSNQRKRQSDQRGKEEEGGEGKKRSQWHERRRKYHNKLVVYVKDTRPNSVCRYKFKYNMES